MKKIALLLVSIFIVGGMAANAQSMIIKAGYNYSNVSIDKDVKVADIKAGRSGWQIGVGWQTEPSYGFSFQPELVYKVKGLKLADAQNMNLGYVEVPLNVQWGPDLVIARPFIFAGPYFGFKVSNQFRGDKWTDTDKETVIKGLHKGEWGLGVGLGLNFLKFQVTGKYNWNFGALADVKDANAAISKLQNLSGSPRTFEISVGLRF